MIKKLNEFLKKISKKLILKIIKFFRLDSFYFENLFIEKKFIEQAVDLANESYPYEFFGYIIGKKKDEDLILTEIIFVQQEGNRNNVKTKTLIFNQPNNYYGTIHSHTINNCTPSKADLKVFQKTPINIIIKYPFSRKEICVYDNYGKNLKYKLK